MASLIARRSFLALSGLATASVVAEGDVTSPETPKLPPQTSVVLDGATLTVRSPWVGKTTRIMMEGDSHYVTDDERGKPFRDYSKRMSDGPKNMMPLREKLEAAQKSGCAAALLLGDTFNFPSEAAIEQLTAVIQQAPLPTYYIAGNHDWHYEGWEGTSDSQRTKFVTERMLPLYGAHDWQAYAVRVGGIKVLMVDDSTCEINAGQLDFLKRELSDGTPALLCMHIPIYIPWLRGQKDIIDYSIGHPDWNEENDPYHEIERRLPWPKEGHSETTYRFYLEVLSSPNLIGVVAGHIHTQRLDVFGNKFQFVLPKATPRTLVFEPCNAPGYSLRLR